MVCTTIVETLSRSLKGTRVETVPRRVPFSITRFIRDAEPRSRMGRIHNRCRTRRTIDRSMDFTCAFASSANRNVPFVPEKTCTRCQCDAARVNVYVLEQSAIYRFHVRSIFLSSFHTNNTFAWGQWLITKKSLMLRSSRRCTFN